MIDVQTLRAMRDELGRSGKLKKAMGAPVTALFPKIATAGHGPPPQQYEEMNKAKWMQTLKDVPIAVAGTAGGYALGRTASEYLLPHIFKSPESQELLKKYLPAASTAVGGLGSAMLVLQRHMLRERREQAARDAAAREARGPVNQEAPVAQTPPNTVAATP